MAQIYTVISMVSFVLAGVFLLISCFLWFKFNIYKIVGDLSGRTAKKGIEKMRKKNEDPGNRPRATYMAGNRQGITEKIETAPTQNDAVNFSNEGTELLPEYERIGALSSNDDDSEGTELLQNETEFLVEDNSQIERLKIVDSIVLIHSNEII